jgi:nucleotide-binding universal stress UspA family protein
MAQRLPVPADVTLSVESMPKAIAEAVHQHYPLLLVMGLSHEHALLDHWLRNQVLPVLRATQQPLLLVPEAAALRPPRRVVLAVDAEPFILNAAALQVAALFGAWPQAAYTVASIPARHEQPAFSGEMALADVRTSGLLPRSAPLELYEHRHFSAVTGIIQALEDSHADLLVLIARPRSFLGRLFHSSVTAQVLRLSPVPVLLLSATGEASMADLTDRAAPVAE